MTFPISNQKNLDYSWSGLQSLISTPLITAIDKSKNFFVSVTGINDLSN